MLQKLFNFTPNHVNGGVWSLQTKRKTNLYKAWYNNAIIGNIMDAKNLIIFKVLRIYTIGWSTNFKRLDRIALIHTEKYSVYLQYECVLNLHKDFTRSLYDFTYILLFKTAQDVEITVQDVETKGNSINLTAYSYWRFFNRNNHLK